MVMLKILVLVISLSIWVAVRYDKDEEEKKRRTPQYSFSRFFIPLYAPPNIDSPRFHLHRRPSKTCSYSSRVIKTIIIKATSTPTTTAHICASDRYVLIPF
jgi:hypothetical protein